MLDEFIATLNGHIEGALTCLQNADAFQVACGNIEQLISDDLQVVLQEMEEINAALKKLKGTLFEDENKLNDMLSELDVLTENIEKYKI